MTKTILKLSIAILISILISISLNNYSMAQSKSEAEIKNAILETLTNLENAFNKHDRDSIASFYANNYQSGDNLNKSQVLAILKDTWDTYPDIHYTSEIKDIRFSDSWASAESYDKSLATSSTLSQITGDKGSLDSDSHSIVYLRKIGKEWKIIGDFTYYEIATVKYGNTKNLDINFSAPEQVKAGQMYSAKISLEVPVGSFAVGSITQEPIIYPTIKLKEKFRTINQSAGGLERVFESNETNNNELVTATVGITELTEDNLARPTVQLKGICAIGSRVNVIPNSDFDSKEYQITNKENIDTGKSEEANTNSSSTPEEINE